MLSDETRTTPFVSAVDTEIEEISQRILKELESAKSTDLSDATYAKMILQLSDINYTKRVLKQVESVASEDKKEIGKRAIIKVLLLSTWLQRLYFIIRSGIMGLMSAVVMDLIILFFGTINVVGGIFIGIFVFVFSLVITRIFDTQIVKATKKVVEVLANHRGVRDFVMNHF
jgi:hypothetical protein